MLTKQGVALQFDAFFVDSTNLDGETGLTVTVDIFEGTSGTPIVTGASATEQGGGFYYYVLASGSVDANANYKAIFKTTSSAVVQKWLPSLWVVGTTLKAVDDVTNDVTIAADQSAVTVGTVTTVTNGVTLADDAITAAKFDESTAFPVKSADTGATQIARVGADGDTLETLSDQIDGVEPADVWAYATRTLTQSAASVAAAVAGSSITITRGDTLTVSFTALGNISARTKLWVTFKTDRSLTDAQSTIQIVEGVTGLVYFNGAAGTAANGSLTVTNETTGALTIVLAAASTDDLDIRSGYYDIQMLTASGVTTLTAGDYSVAADVTRSIA